MAVLHFAFYFVNEQRKSAMFTCLDSPGDAHFESVHTLWNGSSLLLLLLHLRRLSLSVWPCPPWIPVTTAPQSAATGSRRGKRRDQDPRRVTRRTSFTALPNVTFNLEGKERPVSSDRESQPAGAPRSNGASLSVVSQMWSSRIPFSYFPVSVKGRESRTPRHCFFFIQFVFHNKTKCSLWREIDRKIAPVSHCR